MRAPFGFSYVRGYDHDGGSAADLQTDVMRFMAIISLCLVAIFALVQSLPLDRTVVRPPAPSTPQEPTDPLPTATPAPPSPIEQPPLEQALEKPEAEPSPPTEVQSIQLPPAPAYSLPDVDSAEPIPLASTAAPVPSTAPAPASPTEEGFVLRFESDRALFDLVERRTIALYAMNDSETLRLQVSGNSTSFWSADRPRQFHEMDDSTVPPSVVASLKRVTDPRVTWGVTLPPSLRSRLNDYLNSHSGGTLIIGRSGELRLE